MANVLNRTTKEFRTSVNTPDFPVGQWIINPDLSAVVGQPTKYWKITGDVVTLQTVGEQALTDDAEAQLQAANSAGEEELFGDGNDGDIVETVSRTLTQDIYPKLYTVNTGIAIDTAGFRVIAKSGIVNLGAIRDNGSAAVGATAGAGAPSGSLGGGGAGAAGANTAGASAQTLNVDATPGYGGKGGDGGLGVAGAGGSGGAVRSNVNSRVRPRRFETLSLMADVDGINGLVRFQGGGGGGAGSGNGAGGIGGAGGGGGGIVVLIAPVIFNGPGATIEAKGGNGGNASGGNSGGGGGGGGGVIATISIIFRDRGARDNTAGTGGTANGTGVAGAAGNNGRMFNLKVTGGG